MSKAMSFQEFADLLMHIANEHSPLCGARSGKTVKYVDPHIDMRTNEVFALTFRGFGWKHFIHTQNECRDLPESLFERCMAYLDEPHNNDAAPPSQDVDGMGGEG